MTVVKKQNNEVTSFFDSLRIVLRSRNFVVVLFTNYSNSLFLAAFVYMNLFFRDVGISYFELGVANAFSLGVGLLASLLGGYWADSHIHHRKAMVTANMGFVTIGTFLLPSITTFSGLIFVWSIFGLSQFCQSAIDPLLFEAIPKEQMGMGTSLFTVGGIFSLLGFIVVGILINNQNFVEGLKIFFYLTSFVSFLNFLARVKFLESTASSDDQPAPIGNIVRKIGTQYFTGGRVLLATIPIFAIVFLIDVVSDTSFQFAQNFYLNETVQMNYLEINYTMIGATLVGVFGGLFAGRLLDRSVNEAKVMFLVYFFLPFSILLLFFSPMIPYWTLPFEGIWAIVSSTAFIAVVIKSGNDTVWRTIAWGAVGRQLPRQHTGKVMAMLAMSTSVVGMVSSPVVGYIYQIEGGQPLLLISLGLNIIILLFLLAGWAKKAKTNNSQLLSQSETNTAQPTTNIVYD